MKNKIKYTSHLIRTFKFIFPNNLQYMSFLQWLKSSRISPYAIHGGELKRTGERTFSASFIGKEAEKIQQVVSLSENHTEVKEIEL
jgi:hypothetical protein